MEKTREGNNSLLVAGPLGIKILIITGSEDECYWQIRSTHNNIRKVT